MHTSLPLASHMEFLGEKSGSMGILSVLQPLPRFKSPKSNSSQGECQGASCCSLNFCLVMDNRLEQPWICSKLCQLALVPKGAYASWGLPHAGVISISWLWAVSLPFTLPEHYQVSRVGQRIWPIKQHYGWAHIWLDFYIRDIAHQQYFSCDCGQTVRIIFKYYFLEYYARSLKYYIKFV